MWVGLATKVKTLRLPEDVCQTVESFPGENFTEKFVAAARLLGRDRERLIKENTILEEKRKQQYVKLCDMDKLLRKIGLGRLPGDFEITVFGKKIWLKRCAESPPIFRGGCLRCRLAPA